MLFMIIGGQADTVSRVVIGGRALTKPWRQGSILGHLSHDSG